VERRYNASFIQRNATGTYVVEPDEEYTPTVLQSAGIESYMVDLYAYPIFRSSLIQARDTGNFSLSAPYKQQNKWRMGSFLPYFGENDPASLETVGARRANCLGYVVTVLNVEEVFGAVVSRWVERLCNETPFHLFLSLSRA